MANDGYTKKMVRVSLGAEEVAITRALRDFLMQASPEIASNIRRAHSQAMPDIESDIREIRAVARPHQYRAGAMTH